MIHGWLAVGPSGELETKASVLTQLVGMPIAGTAAGWITARLLAGRFVKRQPGGVP